MADERDLREQMDRIYGETPLDEIPWNMEGLSEPLARLIETGAILPCRTIDLGCGAGNQAVALAARGFDVTGVDLSPRAVDLARALAREKGVGACFEVADVTAPLPAIGSGYELAYDWEVLHHVFPDRREAYARNVRSLLAPGGRYLSVCFSERSPQFGGTGKVRRTPMDTELYFSSEDEIQDLYSPQFSILELETIEVKGKHAPHLAVLAFMVRR